MRIDVAVLGAGPYGLSAAAHLARIPGLDVLTFGEPMSFWSRRMPLGMLLRSPWSASHLSDPDGELTLGSFRADTGQEVPQPIPLHQFVAYGWWFQRRAVPVLDGRHVLEVRRENGGYRLIAAAGPEVNARRVVVAAGIGPFAYRPEPFVHLPAGLASHASEHRDLQRFAGTRVAVIGAGQSALETAALLREAAAEVEVIARCSPVRFLRRSRFLHRLGPVSRLLYAPTDVGPAFVSRVAASPTVFRLLPPGLHRRWYRRCTRPAGAAWLLPRLAEVPLTEGVSVVSAEETGPRVRLRLSDGSEREVDHVLLATGYRCEVHRYGFLSRGLLARVALSEGFPRLNAGLESTSAGLHFLGGPSSRTFGPLMNFVAGVDFSARRVASWVAAGTSAEARA